MNTFAKQFTARICLAVLAASFSTPLLAQETGSEARALRADITTVRLDGAIELKIKQGNTPEIVLRGDKERFPRVLTLQDGNTLVIKRKGNWLINWIRSWTYADGPLTVEVTMSALQKIAVQGGAGIGIAGFSGEQMKLDINGSGDVDFTGQYKKINAAIQGSGRIRFAGCTSDEMTLNINGSGVIEAIGQTRALTIVVTGSGTIEAKQLIADTAAISITGSGKADIFSRQTIDVSLTGSSNVHVFGKPVHHQVASIGANNVRFD